MNIVDRLKQVILKEAPSGRRIDEVILGVKMNRLDRIKKIINEFDYTGIGPLPPGTRLPMFNDPDYLKKLNKQIEDETNKKVKDVNKISVINKIKNLFFDTKKHGIVRLMDGLTPMDLREKFPWILKTDISDAVLGIKDNKLVWWNGTWNKGIWEDGIWKSGTWKGGTWKNGILEMGVWEDGIWEKGTWKDGTWKNGTWKNGTWMYGNFNSGTWENGTWENGWFGRKAVWKSGTWKNGIWKGGTWNSNDKRKNIGKK
jgi:hypothetical protein